ncbi:hypothetical protein SELMODRAFT_430459 [Selaginella moellendorffii]|uniref:Transcription factor TFIIIB component B'' Myb domain-containing protein n=1 Tax=Selaginella moellendorffii TaxID=88036 RepID=D8T9H4_SELML|nr:hypothetical protein SELMODRAFT_430459 [Selaginella moellendorffii]
MLATLQALEAGAALNENAKSKRERVPEKKDPEIPLETLSEVELDAIVDHQCEEPLSLQEAPVPTLAPPAPVPDLRTETCTTECSKAKRNKRSVSRKKQEPAVSIDLPTLIKETSLRDFIKITEAEQRKRMKKEKKEKVQKPEESIPVTRIQKEVNVVPQVRIINGSIAIDPKSLTIDARALNEEDPATYRRIDETHRKVNFRTSTAANERWRREETELFYKRLIPGKSRRQIRNKYNREGRQNPRRLSQVSDRDLKEYENLSEDVLKDIAVAAEKEDEFAFTWDVNRNKVG